MLGRKTLELNYKHPVIVDLLEKVKANKDDAVAKSSAEVLFQTALIESGFEIADPSQFVKRVYGLMSKDIGVDPEAPLREVELPEEEAEKEETDDDDDDDDDDKVEEMSVDEAKEKPAEEGEKDVDDPKAAEQVSEKAEEAEKPSEEP